MCMCTCVCTRVCTCVLEHRTAIFNFLIHQRDTAARPWTKRIPGTRIEWLNNSSPTSFSFFLFFFVFFLIHRTLLLLIFIRRGEEFHFYAVHHANSVFAKVENVIGMGWIFLFFSFFFFANNNEMYFGMERKKQKRKNATPILRPGSEVSSGRTGGMHFNRKPERYALHITFCSLVFVLFFSFPSLFLSFFFFCCIRCYAISFRKKH